MSSVAQQTEVYLGTGRRKRASARVRMTPSESGTFTVNGKSLEAYMYAEVLVEATIAPLRAAEKLGQFNIVAKVIGGGPNGQAGAVALGIARALEKFNPELRGVLKKGGHLKRDPRRRERKKAGQPGARKRFQFSKR